MARTYKPRPKIKRKCACGCGRIVTGTPRKRFLNDVHRVYASRGKRAPRNA